MDWEEISPLQIKKESVAVTPNQALSPCVVPFILLSAVKAMLRESKESSSSAALDKVILHVITIV